MRHMNEMRLQDNGKVHILFIDPKPFIRDCFSAFVTTSKPDFHCLTVPSAADAAQAADRYTGVHVVLLNIGAARLSDAEAIGSIEMIRHVLPDVPVVVLSDWDEISLILEGLRRGVRGYLTTDLEMNLVVEAIRYILAGGTFVPSSAFEKILQRSAASDPGHSAAAAALWSEPQPQPQPQAAVTCNGTGFTPRQMEVLACLREGKSNKIIAHELDMCESTVKVHVRHIMKKLKATNRTQVAYLTRQWFTDQA